MLAAMAMAVPTFLVAKVPVPTAVTSSKPRTPSNEAPLTVATVVPSYALFAPAAPITFTPRGVMLAVKPLGCVKV